MATLDADTHRQEIGESARELSAVVECDQDVLSLPFGGRTDWNDTTLSVAAELVYSVVLSTTAGKPGSKLHHTKNGEILEIQRSIASQNVRGIFRAMSGA
jgi:hypothetical protein